MDGRQDIRDVLGLDERTLVHELAAFVSPSAGQEPDQVMTSIDDGDEAEFDPEETSDGTDLGEPLLAEDSLAESGDTTMSRDPDLEAAFGVGRIARSDTDERILIMAGMPPTTIADGSVEQTGPGTWVVDTRSRAPSVVFVGARDHGVALWAANGEIRLYSIAARDELSR